VEERLKELTQYTKIANSVEVNKPYHLQKADEKIEELVRLNQALLKS